MITRKMRRFIIIVIPLIILLFIIALFSILYFTTDLLKSDKDMFFEYLEKNAKNIIDVQEVFNDDEFNKMLQESKYSQNQELKVNYIQNYGTTSENSDNVINKLKLIINGENDNENNYEYKDIKLLNNDEKKAEIEYIKDDTNLGIKFSELYKQYLVMQNDDLKNIFKKAGYSDEQIEKIPNTIEFKNIDIIKFSNQEIEDLVKKYSEIIKQNLTGDRFIKKKNQTVTIDGENITTDEYILKLTKEELNNTYVKLLEKLKDDETILKKIETLQENIYTDLLEMMEINVSEFNNINIANLKDSFINNIETEIQKINKTNIGSEECEIIVYGNKGNVYKTTFSNPQNEISFEHNKSDNNFFSINQTKDGEETKSITLKQKNDNIEILFKDNEKSPSILIKCELNQKNDNEKCNKDINLKYEYNNNRLEINFAERFNMVNEIKNKIDFDNENSINLNYLDSSQIKTLIDKVKTDLELKQVEIMQNIDTNEIVDILKNMGFKKDKMIIENERSF